MLGSDIYKARQYSQTEYFMKKIKTYCQVSSSGHYTTDQIFSGDAAKIFLTSPFLVDFHLNPRLEDNPRQATQSRVSLLKTAVFLMETDDTFLEQVLYDDVEMLTYMRDKFLSVKGTEVVEGCLPLIDMAGVPGARSLIAQVYGDMGLLAYLPGDGCPSNIRGTGSYWNPFGWNRRRWDLDLRKISCLDRGD